MKKTLFILTLFFLLNNVIFATTITSVNSGNWSDSATWDLNRTPLAADTVVINTYVLFNVNFSSTYPGMLNVTVLGTLCGSNTYSGCVLFNGPVFVGSLNINYGTSTSNDTLTVELSIYVGAGASFTVLGNFCGGCPPPCKTSNTGISSIGENETLYIYPNPSNGIFNITPDNITMQSQIIITNMLGEKVYSGEIYNANTTIDLSKENRGMYFYTLIDGKKIITKGKLMLE